MAHVHFIGEIKSCLVNSQCVSVSWAVVPGNFNWFLKDGSNFGETHTHVVSHIHQIPSNEGSVLNFPIDIHYETSTTEGWPFFVCEVWDRKYTDYRSLIGCGSVWLPHDGVHQIIDINIWRPTSNGFEALAEFMLPSLPDLQALREMIICPFVRSEVTTASLGKLLLQMTVVKVGLKENGVL